MSEFPSGRLDMSQLNSLTPHSLDAFVQIACRAAREAGALLRENYGADHSVNEMHQYDIKLELDVRSQQLIEGILLTAFPDHALYGEEGLAGNQESPFQWIVDPIDGTVNYFFAIPHFCVSIALRCEGETIVGVIYDPMMDELFLAQKGHKPTLNGRVISSAKRATLAEAVVTVGFSKSKASIDAGFKRFVDIAYRVRKTRMLGSAALALAYISCGRLDAYIEEIISLWDVAAGILLVESAGGRVAIFPKDQAGEKYSLCAGNGSLPLGEFEAQMEAFAG
jgi:myo-inositol-1(or 4)-monophosphatase